MTRRKKADDLTVPPPAKFERMYTLDELKDQLRVSYQLVNKAAKEGHIKTTKIGSVHRLTETEFKRVLKEGVPSMYVREGESP